MMYQYLWGSNPYFTGPQNYYRFLKIIREIVKTSPNKFVLDLGCGNGELGIKLSVLGYSVVGVDSSSKCVDFIKKTIKQRGLNSNFKVYLSDVCNTNLITNSFDVIVCGEVIEHIDKDYLLIKEICRLLKPGGHLILTTPGHKNKWTIVDKISSHFRRYEIEELTQKLSDTGLKVSKAYYWGFPFGNIWHHYVFTPYLIKMMKAAKQKTTLNQTSRFSFLFPLIALVFYVDEVFNFLRKGDFIFLVAKK